MIGSDILRGYNDIMILSILYSKDSYGYEISKEIFHISKGIYQIKETTLYSAMNRLERLSYITSYQGSITNGKPRTYYAITRRGKEFLEAKKLEWNETKTLIDSFIYEEERV